MDGQGAQQTNWKRFTRFWTKSEGRLLRIGTLIGAIIVVGSAGLTLGEKAVDLFSGPPTRTPTEKAVDRYFADARTVPWASDPRPLPKSRRYIERRLATYDLQHGSSINTLGGLSAFPPEQAALAAPRYAGGSIAIYGGTIISVRLLRTARFRNPSDHNGGRDREGGVFVAQIGESTPGRNGSIFCEFARRTQIFELLPFRRGEAVEAEGVPIMVGTAYGRTSTPGPAAYFACAGVSRLHYTR